MSNDIRDMIESRRHVGVNTSAESFEKSIADRSLTPTLTQLKDYVNGKQLTPGEKAKLTQDIAAARQVQSNANMKSDSLLPEDQAYMSGFTNPRPSTWDYLGAKMDAKDARNNYQRARDRTYLDPTNTSNQGPIDIPGANALLDDISMNVNDQVNKRPMEMAAATQGKLDGIHDRYDRSGRVSDPNKPLAGKLPKRQPPKKDEPTTPKKASVSDPLLEAIHQMRYGEAFQKRDSRLDEQRASIAVHNGDEAASSSASTDEYHNDSNPQKFRYDGKWAPKKEMKDTPAGSEITHDADRVADNYRKVRDGLDMLSRSDYYDKDSIDDELIKLGVPSNKMYDLKQYILRLALDATDRSNYIKDKNVERKTLMGMDIDPIDKQMYDLRHDKL